MYDKFTGRKITLLCTNGEISGTIIEVRKSELVLTDLSLGEEPGAQKSVRFSDILDIKLAKIKTPKVKVFNPPKVCENPKPSSNRKTPSVTSVSSVSSVSKPPANAVPIIPPTPKHLPAQNAKFQPDFGPQICYNNQVIPCCSSLQLLSIRSMLNSYGHSESSIVESTAIGVAMSCSAVLKTNCVRSKTIIVLVGINSGAVQAIYSAHRLACLGAKVIVCSWSQFPLVYRPYLQTFEQVGGRCFYTRAEIANLGHCDLVLDALQGFDGTPIADQVNSEDELSAAIWLLEFASSHTVISIESPSACGNISSTPKAIVSVGFPLDTMVNQNYECPIYLVNLALSQQALESIKLRRHSMFNFPTQQLLECTRRNFIDYAK